MHVSSFVYELTGIDNTLVDHADTTKLVLKQFLDFVGDLVVVGHNVNFDLNFIYDNDLVYFDQRFSNDFVDTMRLSRKLLPELDHHRLSDVSDALNVHNKRAHRAWADCEATFECLEKLYQLGVKQYGSVDQMVSELKPRYRIPSYAEFDP